MNAEPNRLVTDHGTWQEWDVSSPSCPGAIMKIDTSDWIALRTCYKGKVAAFNTRGFIYARVWHKGTFKSIHRIVLGLAPKVWTDHANHDGLDNRRCNIRIATVGENGANRGVFKNNTSGTTGVGWSNVVNKWFARIWKNNKCVYLGAFTELSDAIAARKAAEIEHFGEFRYQSDNS
jgi:hypothetical protein